MPSVETVPLLSSSPPTQDLSRWSFSLLLFTLQTHQDELCQFFIQHFSIEARKMAKCSNYGYGFIFVHALKFLQRLLPRIDVDAALTAVYPNKLNCYECNFQNNCTWLSSNLIKSHLIKTTNYFWEDFSIGQFDVQKKKTSQVTGR